MQPTKMLRPSITQVPLDLLPPLGGACTAILGRQTQAPAQ